MRRAAKIDDNQREIVTALRKVGCEVLSTAAIGYGCGDLLVLGPDKKLYMMEIKNGDLPKSAQKLTPHQIEFHKRWPVHVVTDWAEALNVVAWRKENDPG